MTKFSQEKGNRLFVEGIKENLGDRVTVFTSQNSMFNTWKNEYDGRVVYSRCYEKNGALLAPMAVDTYYGNDSYYFELSEKQQWERFQQELNKGYSIREGFSGYSLSVLPSYSLPFTSQEKVESEIENMEKLFNLAPKGMKLLIYHMDFQLSYLLTTDSMQGFVDNDEEYRTYIEKQQRGALALELIEVEDKIYDLSQKRKWLKERLSREKYVYTGHYKI